MTARRPAGPPRSALNVLHPPVIQALFGFQHPPSPATPASASHTGSPATPWAGRCSPQNTFHDFRAILARSRCLKYHRNMRLRHAMVHAAVEAMPTSGRAGRTFVSGGVTSFAGRIRCADACIRRSEAPCLSPEVWNGARSKANSRINYNTRLTEGQFPIRLATRPTEMKSGLL